MGKLSFFRTLGKAVSFNIGFLAVPDLRRAATNSELYQPTSWWINDKTIFTGLSSQPTGQFGIALMYDGDQVTSTAPVGTGDNENGFGHAHPTVVFHNGEQYFMRVMGQNAALEIYKPSVADGISSYALHASPTTATQLSSYAMYFTDTNGFVNLYTRETAAYHVARYYFNAGLTDFTRHILTDVTTPSSRHYPWKPLQYGTNTIQFFGINHREDQNNSTQFAISLFQTIDDVNYTSIAGAYSKDLTGASVFNDTEIEANFNQYGSHSAFTTFVGRAKGIQVNDIMVWARSKKDGSDMYMHRIENGVQVKHRAPFNDGVTRAATNIEFRWNGNNIVAVVNFDDLSLEVWGINLECTIFQRLYSVPTEFTTGFVLPVNFDEVQGNYCASVGAEEGVCNYVITNDKFLI